MFTNLSTRTAALVVAAMLSASAHGAVAGSAPGEGRRLPVVSIVEDVLGSLWSWIAGEAGWAPEPSGDETVVPGPEPLSDDGWGMDPNGGH